MAKAKNAEQAAEEQVQSEEVSPEIEVVEAASTAPTEEVTEEVVATEGVERKHKNRESTSEKAKRAAVEREAKGESAEPAPQRQLDPLRLRGKKYREVVKLVDRTKVYSIEEALELAKKTSIAKFDGAIELHVKVKGEGVRGTVSLPHGTGKTVKVAVANDETIEAIAAGKLDFDILLATPSQMPKLAKYAKVLGPKGLMPSPKAGTVTDDLEKARAEIGGGRVEYRADKTGVVHMAIGRVSYSTEQLLENYRVVEQVLVAAKPQSVAVAATMGPGVKVELPQ